jgi:hypothetical protein
VDPAKVVRADREYVRRCLEAYFARLPDALRTGWGRPQVTALPNRFLGAVPNDMADGPPDPAGRVRWRWLEFDPSPWDWLYNDLPPVYGAYHHYHRVCRFVLRDERSSFILPPTPTPYPGFALLKLDGDWRTDQPTEGRDERTGFWPLGWSEDGTDVICADMHRRGPDGDAPVVAIDRTAAFRLRPRVVASRDRRPLLAPLARPLFGSFRDMLGHFCLGSGCRWTGREPFPLERCRGPVPEPFDWEPWLDPEPPPDRPAPDQSGREPDPRAVADHLDRIAAKVRFARVWDPARLGIGAIWHEYALNPPLWPEERAGFEGAHRVRLPEAYAQFLMRVGNGGTGPGGGLRRLEDRALGRCEGDVPLAAPFPHRVAWAAPPDPPDPDDFVRPLPEDDPTRGSQLLGRWPMSGEYIAAVLVVTGAERGHVWVDQRDAYDPDADDLVFCRPDLPRGVVPVMRRGPYSFLAWYEGHLDALIDQADLLYAAIVPDGTPRA